MKLPWISRREHDRLMRLERQWTMQEARNNLTFAMRQSARDGYKKGVEDTRAEVLAVIDDESISIPNVVNRVRHICRPTTQQER